MKINDFFTAAGGETAKLYTLTNGTGFEVDVSDWGGTLVSLRTPDRDGKSVDVLLGFQNPEDYGHKGPYFGALIGRFANRIPNGRFMLNGKEYNLELNDNGRPNSLHGGKSYAYRLWNAEVVDDATLKLTLFSPDGDAGYPGNLNVEVTYHVTAANELCIDYKAVTDAPTMVNLTNHAYFNLNGEESLECKDHVVWSICEGHTEVNDVLAPTGRTLPSAGTIFDLRNGQKFEDIYASPEAPIAFDDNFVVAAEAGTFRKNVFTVLSNRTGIRLEVDTDQPGVQFYMGYWLDGSCLGKCGKYYPRFGAFCLESQLWPDSTNQKGFPNPVLNPGETYTHKTVYRFGVEK